MVVGGISPYYQKKENTESSKESCGGQMFILSISRSEGLWQTKLRKSTTPRNNRLLDMINNFGKLEKKETTYFLDTYCKSD